MQLVAFITLIYTIVNIYYINNLMISYCLDEFSRWFQICQPVVVSTLPQPSPRRRLPPSDDFEESDDGVDGEPPSPTGTKVADRKSVV